MVFKRLGRIKVGYQELIRDYLPEYESDRKKTAFEKALKVHFHDEGEIVISRVMCDSSSFLSEPFVKKEFSLMLNDSFYDYTKTEKNEEAWFSE